MARIMNILIKEFVIILALWMGGWVIFYAGARGMNDYKKRYWQESIVTKQAYQNLSPVEKAAAEQQYMELWQVKLGDEPFRQGGYGIRVAYGAQAGGFWLKTNWLLCYILLGFLRIGLSIRTSYRKRPASYRMTGGERLTLELRILIFFAVMAVVWYLVWALLAPSLYVSFKRFYTHSYEYLWNNRLHDFGQLATFWPYILLGYPLSLLLRLVWGIRTMIRKNMGF
jgi:hypothetical protein